MHLMMAFVYIYSIFSLEIDVNVEKAIAGQSVKNVFVGEGYNSVRAAKCNARAIRIGPTNSDRIA